MARPSVIPAILERLKIYLNECEIAYQSQPLKQRNPILPATPDGKVNVRAVAKAIELKSTQEKYLYERVELTQLINLVAEGQGLLPIGSRLVLEVGDQVLKARLVEQAQQAKASAQAAVEAYAAQFEILERLQVATSEIEMLKAENVRLRAQLDSIQTGMFVRVED